MGIKKFRSIFMRYILLLAFGLLMIIIINFSIYMFSINQGIILPMYQIQERAEIAQKKLQVDKKMQESDIPDFCEFAFYSTDGIYQSGSIDRNIANQWWEDAVEKQEANDRGYKFIIVNNDKETAILKYRNTAQFKNATIRKIVPIADFLFVGGIVLELFLLLLIIYVRFGKNVSREMDKLLLAVKKIEQQDLEFEFMESSILEINRVLIALIQLKSELKQSLTKQWYEENLHQEQLSALLHDLKTPLTIVQGNTELLLDTKLSEEQKECADYIEMGSLQIQNYVQTLIETTKSCEVYRVHKEDFSVCLVLQEVKKQADGLCAMNNLTFCCEYKQKSQYVKMDYQLIERALVNIIANAVEHTESGGMIFLKVQADNERLSFIVEDTGKGFSNKALKHAMERFYMDDDSRNSNFHYGIGLYSVSRIAQLHGGQLILENSEEKSGAKVTLEISC